MTKDTEYLYDLCKEADEILERLANIGLPAQVYHDQDDALDLIHAVSKKLDEIRVGLGDLETDLADWENKSDEACAEKENLQEEVEELTEQLQEAEEKLESDTAFHNFGMDAVTEKWMMDALAKLLEKGRFTEVLETLEALGNPRISAKVQEMIAEDKAVNSEPIVTAMNSVYKVLTSTKRTFLDGEIPPSEPGLTAWRRYMANRCDEALKYFHEASNGQSTFKP